MNTQEIKTLWRELPLAKDNDMAAIDSQIERNPKVWQAVGEFLRSADLSSLPLGRNEIGEGAYANVQEYNTKLTSVYELHRRYIDVQLLTSGEELVFVAPKEQALEPQGEFSVDGDFILYATAEDARPLLVNPQSYLVLFPTDAHMPCMAIDGQSMPVRKIVVKIPFA